MLPESLFEWWYEPWKYAPHISGGIGPELDRVGLRDGYRLWCRMHGLQESLPGEFDHAWSVVAETEPSEMIPAARLFAGLIAAREQDVKVLTMLRPSERKWCLGVAATQPLQACRTACHGDGDSMEVRGFVELGRRLERGFPGMWMRVRLMLPADLSNRAAQLLGRVLAAGEAAEASAARAQRCWRLCRDQVRLSGRAVAVRQ